MVFVWENVNSAALFSFINCSVFTAPLTHTPSHGLWTVRCRSLLTCELTPPPPLLQRRPSASSSFLLRIFLPPPPARNGTATRVSITPRTRTALLLLPLPPPHAHAQRTLSHCLSQLSSVPHHTDATTHRHDELITASCPSCSRLERRETVISRLQN